MLSIMFNLKNYILQASHEKILSAESLTVIFFLHKSDIGIFKHFNQFS